MNGTTNSSDDVLFNRNNSDEADQYDKLKQVVNNIIEKEQVSAIYPSEILNARKRLLNKFLEMRTVQTNVKNLVKQTEMSDINIFDEDMLIVGSINYNNELIVDVPPIKIIINLVQLIRNAMLTKSYRIIRILLDHEIDLFKLEPRIMCMCAETDHDKLMFELIEKKIPIHTEDYRCIYYLAANGKLELLKEIMKNYTFPSVVTIVGKICVQAIMNSHVNVLEYFCPKESIICAPDIMFTFFIKGIEHGGSIDVIKYFIDAGISIKQENYMAVKTAVKFNRGELIEYFIELDNNVKSLLTSEELDLFGLGNKRIINKWIGLDENCHIDYDDIVEGDAYYMCNNKIEPHYYHENAWTKVIKRKPQWICLHCFSPVEKVVYVNKQ